MAALFAAKRESAQPATLIAIAASAAMTRMQQKERFKMNSPARIQPSIKLSSAATRWASIFVLKLARGPACVRRTPRLSHQPACKPGSVGHRPLARAIRDGHSSGAMFAHGLEQPTRTTSLTSLPRRYRFREHSAFVVPIRSCSRCGLPCRVRCRTRGALLPHLFTLTAPPFIPPRKRRGLRWGSGSFSVALSLGLPPPDVIRHRMSMEPGLSSPAAFRPMRRAPRRDEWAGFVRNEYLPEPQNDIFRIIYFDRLDGRYRLDATALSPHHKGISRPDGRSGDHRKVAGEESPGSIDIRCRITSGGGNPRDSATEIEPLPPTPKGRGQ